MYCYFYVFVVSFVNPDNRHGYLDDERTHRVKAYLGQARSKDQEQHPALSPEHHGGRRHQRTHAVVCGSADPVEVAPSGASRSRQDLHDEGDHQHCHRPRSDPPQPADRPADDHQAGSSVPRSAPRSATQHSRSADDHHCLSLVE